MSHGCALIRSPKSQSFTFNIDILFFGVEYLATPRHLGRIGLDHATENEIGKISKLLGKEVKSGHIVILTCEGRRHSVAAAKVIVRESDMDIFDSPFATK